MQENGNGHLINDDIDARIVSRLGERNYKYERIKEWNNAKSRNRRLAYYYTTFTIAACLALFFVVNPFAGGNPIEELGIERPRVAVFRSAIPELEDIDKLIDAGKYYEALDMTEPALKKSDNKIKQHEKHVAGYDEELLYEYHAEKMLNAELRWMYIYLLVMTECDRSAVKELKRYLKDDEFCTHKSDAEALLKALV